MTRATLAHARDVAARHVVGVNEIALRLGTVPTTVRSWRWRYAAFPAPLPHCSVAGHPAYWWPDIEAWARETGHGTIGDPHAHT